jgi:hypothetical protein
MGDVIDDVDAALKQMGLPEVIDEIGDDEFFPGIAKALHKRGVKTLYGTRLRSEPL